MTRIPYFNFIIYKALLALTLPDVNVKKCMKVYESVFNIDNRLQKGKFEGQPQQMLSVLTSAFRG